MRCGAIKYFCQVDADVGGCGNDESEVALVTSPEAAWDRSTIGADFFLQLCESFIVWFSWDLCQRGVLEVILDVFGGVEDHFCGWCLIVIDCVVQDVGDNTVSSDTKLN